MDLEVVGRHALFFDDDAMASFVNSSAALVDWNSLSIDRYDVRHLLSSPPPPRSRRRHHYSDDSLESELDLERYFDLTAPSYHQDSETDANWENVGRYHAVSFSYGNLSEPTNQKNADMESGFRPSFPVPEHLVLPPTEKVHLIMARTAMFVIKHGGQSEIVLRVKQGDNPTFGFLMPDHDLHPYFRFLVDHEELLKSDMDSKSIEEENKVENGLDQTGGALSLLGSVYGSGEDEEGNIDVTIVEKKDSEEAVNADNVVISSQLEAAGSVKLDDKDKSGFKLPVPSLREKAHMIKKNRSISAVKAGTTTGVNKGEALGVISSAVDKLQASSSPNLTKVEPSILEPPSDLKRVVEKIVEFILRNGKEFEAVLVQQDTKHGRFPFLLPSNQYHPYYLNVLERAQEAKSAGKGLISEKRDSLAHGMDKKSASRKSDALSLSSDIPHDTDRKEKFKMVIGKSKKDGQDPPSKAPQVGVSVDAAAAAAILQAATKGIKNPHLEILSKTSINGVSQGPSTESRWPSSFSSKPSSHPQSSIKKLYDGEPGVSIPMAGAISKTAAIAAANEADSSEANLTKEQKLKAERLKRAKIFAAMIKTGAVPLKSESLHGLSAEAPESGFSASGSHAVNLAGREREDSSVKLDVDTSDRVEKPEMKGSADLYNERRSKRRYRSRSKIEEEEDVAEEENRDHKHSRKKKRHHDHRSRHSRDRQKRKRNHGSSKEKDSQHWHKHDSAASDEECRHARGRSVDEEHWKKHDSSSDYEYRHARHGHKNDCSSSDEHRHKDVSSSDDENQYSRQRHKHGSSSLDKQKHSRHRKKHDSSSSDEHYQRSRHRHRHCSSSDDEDHRRSKSAKHGKISRLEREADLEEGEILTKSDQSKASEGGEGASREASVDMSKTYRDVRSTSQPTGTTEVSDDLRAKIRAMLMATL